MEFGTFVCKAGREHGLTACKEGHFRVKPISQIPGVFIVDQPIFREKSVKQVSSPEELNHYMKVTTPRVWIVLVAIVLVLAGAISWSIFGSVTVTGEDGSRQEVKPITFIMN